MNKLKNKKALQPKINSLDTMSSTSKSTRSRESRKLMNQKENIAIAKKQTIISMTTKLVYYTKNKPQASLKESKFRHNFGKLKDIIKRHKNTTDKDQSEWVAQQQKSQLHHLQFNNSDNYLILAKVKYFSLLYEAYQLEKAHLYHQLQFCLSLLPPDIKLEIKLYLLYNEKLSNLSISTPLRQNQWSLLHIYLSRYDTPLLSFIDDINHSVTNFSNCQMQKDKPCSINQHKHVFYNYNCNLTKSQDPSSFSVCGCIHLPICKIMSSKYIIIYILSFYFPVDNVEFRYKDLVYLLQCDDEFLLHYVIEYYLVNILSLLKGYSNLGYYTVILHQIFVYGYQGNNQVIPRNYIHDLLSKLDNSTYSTEVLQLKLSYHCPQSNKTFYFNQYFMDHFIEFINKEEFTKLLPINPLLWLFSIKEKLIHLKAKWNNNVDLIYKEIALIETYTNPCLDLSKIQNIHNGITRNFSLMRSFLEGSQIPYSSITISNKDKARRERYQLNLLATLQSTNALFITSEFIPLASNVL